MNLYKLTNGLGDYWVVSTDPTAAQDRLHQVLEYGDYGFRDERKVKNVELIAEEIVSHTFITGKHLLLPLSEPIQ